MNLAPLFELQKAFDDRVVREKGLEGRDLMPNKILALQVGLGKLANEWQGFKVDGSNHAPRVFVIQMCETCRGDGRFDDITCPRCNGEGSIVRNRVLEEYIDCLQLILSIGLQIDAEVAKWTYVPIQGTSIVDQFNHLYATVALVRMNSFSGANFHNLMISFLGLGDQLGLTWDQIEQAFIAKDKENHAQLHRGYWHEDSVHD